MLLLVAACSSGPADTITITVGDETLEVWVADTVDERRQGLRGLAELPEGIDGMLFVWDAIAPRNFTMEDTLIPLDIWWFDADHRLAGLDSVLPCDGSPCPLYPSPGPTDRVLETPAGELALAAGALLSSR